MTKREKELLTKVLCEQFPYGVKVCVQSGDDLWTLKGVFEGEYSGIMTVVLPPFPSKNAFPPTSNFAIDRIKPYLRPLSSMTEEEKKELKNILPCSMSFDYTISEELIICTDPEYDSDHFFSCFVEVQDFLNAHHFDFRGLIPMGLAIAAVGENNPYKEKGGEE